MIVLRSSLDDIHLNYRFKLIPFHLPCALYYTIRLVIMIYSISSMRGQVLVVVDTQHATHSLKLFTV